MRFITWGFGGGPTTHLLKNPLPAEDLAGLLVDHRGHGEKVLNVLHAELTREPLLDPQLLVLAAPDLVAAVRPLLPHARLLLRARPHINNTE
eukprot:1195567-Prorocentrum_minimum.AAC.2